MNMIIFCGLVCHHVLSEILALSDVASNAGPAVVFAALNVGTCLRW